MIEDVFRRVRASPRPAFDGQRRRRRRPGRPRRARITLLEQGDEADRRAPAQAHAAKTLNRPPVVGITGTGGAGKSSVTDELLNRFLALLPGRAHRRDRGRPDAPPHRRRAARRPHPHELAAQRARLHALDGDAPPAPRDHRRARRTRISFLKSAGLRPGHRRDRRHRPERHRRSSTSSTSRCT